MKPISALTSNSSIVKTQNGTNEMVSITVPKSSMKSALMLAASMLSLAALGKADINISNTYQNEVAKVSYTCQNNREILCPQKEHVTEPQLSDEEKIHRFAIAFSLVGFFAPLISNIFTYDKKTNNYE